MSGPVTRRAAGVPALRLRRRNYMTFPCELRNAIPDLPTYVGRTLELSSTHGHASHTRLFGARVHLALGIHKTGKLKGRFTVGVDLELEAARALAASLIELADRAEKLPEAPIPPGAVHARKRK
ncbi:MAG TPA: hypothetical protein VME43_29745 [Bryobacteraceae bacterium]|nr:hypothetical protein [Bryobacteraceae bacterium]